jgi:hypothetical protein
MLKPLPMTVRLSDLPCSFGDAPDLDRLTSQVEIAAEQHHEVARIQDAQVYVTTRLTYAGAGVNDPQQELAFEQALAQFGTDQFEMRVIEGLSRRGADAAPQNYSPLAAAVQLLMVDEPAVLDLLLEQGDLQAAIEGLLTQAEDEGWTTNLLCLLAETGQPVLQEALKQSRPYQDAILTALQAGHLPSKHFWALRAVALGGGNVTFMRLVSHLESDVYGPPTCYTSEDTASEHAVYATLNLNPVPALVQRGWPTSLVFFREVGLVEAELSLYFEMEWWPEFHLETAKQVLLRRMTDFFPIGWQSPAEVVANYRKGSGWIAQPPAGWDANASV